MGAIADSANQAWREFEDPFAPVLGTEHEPIKAEIRTFGTLIDITLTSAMTGLVIGNSVSYATRAELYADLAHAAGVLGVVYDDTTNAYNGIYAKSGASGAGSWAITDIPLPASFAADLAAVMSQLDAVDAAVAAAAASAVAGAGSAASALLSSTSALAYSTSALSYRDQAIAAAENAGINAFYDTKAAATAAVGGLSEGDRVGVWADEDHDNHETRYVVTSGALVFKIDLTAIYLARLQKTGVCPEDYGAVGDGTTYDAAGLIAARDAAGVSGTVRLTPGKTYLVGRSIRPLDGQTWICWGAKIKRCDAITATTTTAINLTGTVSVTVDDVSGFEIGMEIAARTGQTTGTANTIITNINPGTNTITVSPAFSGLAVGSGNTLTTSFEVIAPYTGVTVGYHVIGLEIDGNKANNTAFTKWPNHTDLTVQGAGAKAESCYVHDSIGDAIMLVGAGASGASSFGTDPASAIGCRVKDANGNGIHLSGTLAAVVERNFVYNVNIKKRAGTAIGHDDGGIIASDSVGYTMVSNNYVEEALSAIGSWDYAYNHGLTVSNNIFRNCDGAFEGIFPTAEGGLVVFTGNIWEDCGVFSINQTDAGSALRPSRYKISGGLMSGTRFEIIRAKNVSIHGVHMDGVGDVTNPAITVISSENVKITDNTIAGFVNALFATGAGMKRLKFNDNDCLNQYARCINLDNPTLPVGSVVANDNEITVESTFTADAGFYGAVLSEGTEFRRNTVKIEVASTAHAVYCGGDGIICSENVVRATLCASAIKAEGGTEKIFIVRNFYDGTIINGGGAANTVADNYDLAA